MEDDNQWKAMPDEVFEKWLEEYKNYTEIRHYHKVVWKLDFEKANVKVTYSCN